MLRICPLSFHQCRHDRKNQEPQRRLQSLPNVYLYYLQTKLRLFRIAKYGFLTKLKIYYYEVILLLYRHLGRFVDMAYTNSSWTQGHMQGLWGVFLNNKLRKLYPPCNVETLVNMDKNNQEQTYIMSFAQFRPEKKQLMQVQIYRDVLTRLKNQGFKKQPPKFIMVGSVRGPGDQEILDNIKLAAQPGDQKQVIILLDKEIGFEMTFQVNQPFERIVKIFEQSTYGLHTMEAQHFGITCVEMLAAGLIVVAHDSAGPKYDIVGEDCGFLAGLQEGFAQKLYQAIMMDDKSKKQLRNRARKKAQTFSDEAFVENFARDFNEIIGKKIN